MKQNNLNIINEVVNLKGISPIETISELGAKLDCDEETIKDATELYQNVADEYKGSIQCYVASACLLTSIRTGTCEPVSLHEFLQAMKELNMPRRKCMLKIYRDIILQKPQQVKSCQIRPTIHIRKLCNKLKLSKEVKREAYKVSLQAIKKRLTLGRSPLIIAAAIVYAVANQKGEHRSQREVAETAGTTENSIRSVGRALELVSPLVSKTLPIEQLEPYFLKVLEIRSTEACDISRWMHYHFKTELSEARISPTQVKELVERNIDKLELVKWRYCKEESPCPCGECDFYYVRAKQPT